MGTFKGSTPFEEITKRRQKERGAIVFMFLKLTELDIPMAFFLLSPCKHSWEPLALSQQQVAPSLHAREKGGSRNETSRRRDSLLHESMIFLFDGQVQHHHPCCLSVSPPIHRGVHTHSAEGNSPHVRGQSGLCDTCWVVITFFLFTKEKLTLLKEKKEKIDIWMDLPWFEQTWQSSRCSRRGGRHRWAGTGAA